MINGLYPVETAFMSNSDKAWRDPIKKNRIHFKLPETWSNSRNNSVIGVRNIFISKAFKHPVIKFSYQLMKRVKFNNEESTTTSEVEGASGSVIVDKFFDDETMLKDFISDRINPELDKIDLENYFDKQVLSQGLETTPGLTQASIDTIKDTNYLLTTFEYTIDSSTNEHYIRFVISSPFNDLSEDIRSYEYTNTQTYDVVKITYSLIYDITLLNTDAQNMFKDKQGAYDDNPIYFNQIWDRNSCIVFSSISEQADNAYLGHTRKQVIPVIKYYKINGSRSTFWIDLYATCDHKAPVVLPPDDEVIIEAQLF